MAMIRPLASSSTSRRQGQPSLDRRGQRVCELKDQGIGATDIAKALGIGRTSVYRLLLDADEGLRPD
jgi:DNA invertase Pin-like site-specific DNA recombinase